MPALILPTSKILRQDYRSALSPTMCYYSQATKQDSSFCEQERHVVSRTLLPGDPNGESPGIKLLIPPEPPPEDLHRKPRQLTPWGDRMGSKQGGEAEGAAQEPLWFVFSLHGSFFAPLTRLCTYHSRPL